MINGIIYFDKDCNGYISIIKYLEDDIHKSGRQVLRAYWTFWLIEVNDTQQKNSIAVVVMVPTYLLTWYTYCCDFMHCIMLMLDNAVYYKTFLMFSVQFTRCC